MCCAVLSCLVVSNFCDPMDCSPPGSSFHGDSPDKNTGVGYHSLLQGIFPTQGSNPSLLHCRHVLYHLSHHQRSVLISRKKRDMPTVGHYFYFIFEFFSIMAYYTIFNIVCLSYLQQFVSANLKLLTYCPHVSPLVTISLCSVYMNLFCKKIICIFFRFHI